MGGCGCRESAGNVEPRRLAPSPRVASARPGCACDQQPCACGQGPAGGELDARRVAPCGNDTEASGRLWPRSQRLPAPLGATPVAARLTRLGAYATPAGGSGGAELFAMLDGRRGRPHPGGGELLPARGGNCPRVSSGAAVSLVPGARVFQGTAPRGAPGAGRATDLDRSLRELPANLRGLAMAMGGPRAGVGGGGLVPRLVPVSPFNVVSPPWVPLETSATEPWAGGAAAPPATSPCATGSLAEALLSRAVVVRYADVEFCVDEDWLLEKEEHGGWMGADDVLEILWNNALGHGQGVDREAFAEMVDCWMLDLRKATSGRSYSSFFANKGGPWEFLYYTCELVSRFDEFAREGWSGTTRCEHFQNALGNMVRGESTRSLRDSDDVQHGPCTLHWLVVSSETDVKRRVVTSCESTREVRCHEFRGEKGEGWYGGQFDDWSAELVRYNLYGDAYWLWAESDTGSREGPATDPLASAYPSAFAVRIPATRLAWEGFILDFAMYWARAALQRSFETGSLADLATAWAFARAGLARLLSLGDLLVHECGHVYMGGGGHCECRTKPDCNCCFDMAASAWRCRTRARLGLPHESLLSCAEPLASLVDTKRTCGADDGKTSFYPFTCEIDHPCFARSPVNVSAGSCYSE